MERKKEKGKGKKNVAGLTAWIFLLTKVYNKPEKYVRNILGVSSWQLQLTLPFPPKKKQLYLQKKVYLLLQPHMNICQQEKSYAAGKIVLFQYLSAC